MGGWPPTAGSYATTLTHYERAIGSQLPEPRNRIRCLVLLLDPRDSEDKFVACDPLRDPVTLGFQEHRYFCLTSTAWRNLGLDRWTGSRRPVWPDENSAHHFLRRYFGRGSWSYDGFLAYFLFLLRPEAAYITNLAKCHLGGESQLHQVYETCCRRHLNRELEMFAANVVLSFSSKVSSLQHLRELCGSRSQHIRAVLYAYHPAAPGKGYEAKRLQFSDALERNSLPLRKLGLDLEHAQSRWNLDVGTLARQRRG